jgi:N-methylhydantoinase A
MSTGGGSTEPEESAGAGLAGAGAGIRMAIDIGGTFTDATLIDEESGAVSIAKVLTTPADPSEGFMAAVRRALAEGGVEATQVQFVVHATTVATNAIIEGKIARSGFVTTEGFRDLLEIARQVRPSLYDTQFEKAPPLVPRDRAVGVRERLGPAGEVLTPLDDDSVREAAALLRREQVESVAVCLLHSYVNPAHEQRVGEILAEELPGVPVSLSAEVAPEFREYLRASTTVINAVIRPVVERYLARIESRLAEAGVRAKLLVMQSSGGVFSSDAAARKPVFMVESGPAAGVIASAYLGETLGKPDILSFDMGGTTAKVGLIQGGQPSVTKDYNVGGHAGAGIGGMSLSGYPVRTPVVDLVEIGAGGGSIAWVDSGGLLRVGPRSAGADPGPVCYRRGGVEPTVTDANVVLGRLNPGYFLGGEMGLDIDGARVAIEERCAKPLGLDVTAAAYGIVEIANAAMVNALNLISVQRGYDPRDFVLVGFGGAGPVHANAIARDAEMPTLLIPRSPGIFSATGLLTTDLKRDAATTIMRRLDELDPAEAEATFVELEAAGRTELQHEGVADDAIEFVRQIDLRYVGQSYELTIPAGDGLLERFHAEHDRTYGFAAPEEPVEAVSLRLTSVGRIAKPPARKLDAGGAPEPKERRPVYYAEADGYVDCPIYDRYALPAGARLAGPAIVEEFDSTTVVHPGFSVSVDETGNLIIERERS